MILGLLIYSAFYPQPYVNEVLRDVPIAVVDQDHTVSSRELARRIDATPDAAIVSTFPDLPTAQAEVYARRIFGILVIPKDFERELLHGRASPVALYADASYFLIYQRVSQSVAAVARTLGAEIEAIALIGVGVDPALAMAASDPMPLTVVSLFNPEGGYATYLLPAAFVLLVQQTLLIGVGLLGTLPGGRTRADDEDFAGMLVSIAGKLLAYLALEAVIIPLYLVALPYLYGLPRLGSVLTILVFAVPFVLAVSTLGMVLAEIFRKPLAVQLATAALGLPFFFLAGFAWPVSAIPQAVQYLSLLVPSSLAIGGFVRISQLGASLPDVRSQFLSLWVLAAFYIGVVLLLKVLRATRREPQYR
jgi:ABC-2 type transport system permease protein